MSNLTDAEEKRRGELRKVVEHFRGKPLTQTVIDEFCNLNKIEIVALEDFDDLLFQVEHDEKMVLLLKDILAELQNLQFEPVFVSGAERKGIEESNEAVRVAIAKAIEKHAISELMLERLGNTLKDIVGNPIEMAGNTVFNRANSVKRTLAQKHFGLTKLRDFTSKHVCDFHEALEEAYKKSAEK